jgi:hypothetical protein
MRFDSPAADVGLEIIHRELEASGDTVMSQLILFGKAVNVSTGGLKVVSGLIYVQESSLRGCRHLTHCPFHCQFQLPIIVLRLTCQLQAHRARTMWTASVGIDRCSAEPGGLSATEQKLGRR